MPDVYLTDSADLETKFTSDLEARARAALSRSRIYVLRKLHIELDGDAVILRGRVDSFYHKQLAQELVRMAVEGTEVINAISVVYNHRADDAALGMHW